MERANTKGTNHKYKLFNELSQGKHIDLAIEHYQLLRNFSCPPLWSPPAKGIIITFNPSNHFLNFIWWANTLWLHLFSKKFCEIDYLECVVYHWVVWLHDSFWYPLCNIEFPQSGAITNNNCPNFIVCI